jgi:hypothetical protein
MTKKCREIRRKKRKIARLSSGHRFLYLLSKRLGGPTPLAGDAHHPSKQRWYTVLMHWFHWSIEKLEALRNPPNCQIVIMQKDSDER